MQNDELRLVVFVVESPDHDLQGVTTDVVHDDEVEVHDLTEAALPPILQLEVEELDCIDIDDEVDEVDAIRVLVDMLAMADEWDDVVFQPDEMLQIIEEVDDDLIAAHDEPDVNE